jgi:hypothetical protein
MKSNNITSKKSEDSSRATFIMVLSFFIISLAIFICFVFYYGYFIKSTGYVAYSGYVNFTISSAILLNISQNTVNWGSGNVNTSGGFNNATLMTHGTGAATITGGNWSTSAKALVIENFGNVNCSIKLAGTKTAHQFFGSLTSENESYQWNISNKDAGACGEWNETAAQNTFANVNTTQAIVCNKLNYIQDHRAMYIDFLMSIPADANTTIASGNVQSDTITITGDPAI